MEQRFRETRMKKQHGKLNFSVLKRAKYRSVMYLTNDTIKSPPHMYT
jgi:hypothetical protein